MAEETPNEEITPEVPVEGTDGAPDGTQPEPNTEEKPEETTTEEEGQDKEPEKDPDVEEDPTTDEETSEVESEYENYDDPSLKQVVNIFKEVDLPVAEANAIFAKAVETGDLSQIDKATLVEKVGEDKADIVIALAENYYNKTNGEFQKVRDQVFDQVGGEEAFNEIVSWAQNKAASDEKFAADLADYRAMIDTKNPKAVQAAVKELQSLYKADPNTTIKPDLVKGDGAGVGADNSPLTAQAFKDAVNKAVADGTYNDVQKSLYARRAAGRAQNIQYLRRYN